MKQTLAAEARWAYAIARIGLGINIALHGWVRIPHFESFEAHLIKQFEGSFLNFQMIQFAAFGIVAAESVIGLMLLLGLFTRTALVAGGMLMWVLLFGVCLVQNWSAAGSQLVYLAFFCVLLASVRYNSFAIDNWDSERDIDP